MEKLLKYFTASRFESRPAGDARMHTFHNLILRQKRLEKKAVVTKNSWKNSL